MALVTDIHPRITVHPVSLMRPTLGEYIEALSETGISRSAVFRAQLDPADMASGLDRMEAAGLALSHLAFGPMFTLDKPESWHDQRAALGPAIDLAARYENRIYGITGAGPAVGLTWEKSCAAFAAAIAPAAEQARANGVSLMIEPALPLFSELHFVHTQRDVLHVAEAADIDICFDINAAWNERGLAETIARSVDRTGLVQVSDWNPKLRTTDRVAPGDGVVDLPRIIGALLDAGYQGPFDLELWGDAGIPDVEAVRRGAAHLSDLLGRLGA